MRKNKITVDELEGIICRHIDNDKNFLFVCNYIIAQHICDFLKTEYEIEDEDSELNRKVNEYYITHYNNQFYCEVARGSNGEYKSGDLYNVDYFIFTDMSEAEVDAKLIDDLGTWSWAEIVDEIADEEEDCCDGDCENCELNDEEEEELSLIADYVEKVLNANGCVDCTFEALIDLAYAFKNIGYRDCKDYVQSCIDDLE
jgi:hypothetical protein